MIRLNLLVLFCSFMIAGQPDGTSQILFSESFENGIPGTWEQDPVVGNDYWKYRNGGHSPNDPNWTVPPGDTDITRNPPLAQTGTYNAIFFKQSDNRERTKLITPKIDLQGVNKPELSFWVAQVPWTFSGATNWDQLRVYFRTTEGAEWVLLLEVLDPLYEWAEYRVNLPNPTSTYQIAFEGETFWGYGTCVDNVVIEEKGVVQRWIGDLSVNQASINFAPSGSPNIPILRMDYRVYGNTGEAVLERIGVTSLNTDDADVAANGVKLYSTPTATFNTDNPLGNFANFNGNGEAIFDNINHSLPDGLSYVWVTYDVSANATHNNRLNAMIKANAILANDSLYPSSDESPPGSRVIYQTVYREDFESVHGWVTTGQFTVGTPSGEGGSPGNPDPVGAYSGINAVYHPGNYAPNLTNETAYKAISPSINLQHFKGLMLSYRRYLNTEYWDNISIKISTNGGETWANLWESNNYFSDFQWNQSSHTIASNYWRNPDTRFKFQVGPTDGFRNYSGLSFDDVVVTGEFISKDVGVTEWVSPLTGCGHTSAEEVVVKVANLGGADIVAPVPVQVSFNGGVTWITNTLNQVIPVGETINFTFSTKANLSEPGLRSDVRARTNLDGDQYTSNNQIKTQIYVLPTYFSPSFLDFHINNKHWRAFGHTLWEYGTASGETISPIEPEARSWNTGNNYTYGSTFSGTNHIVFEDGFEEDLGWTFTGKFERSGFDDWDYAPYSPNTGDYLIGTDLTWEDDNNYYYENGITEATAYTATSPPIDVSQYTNVTVGFYRSFVILEGDFARIEVSPDNTIWHTIWDNEGQEVNDVWGWEEVSYSVNDVLTSNQFRVRFSLYSTSAEGPVAEGLNVDDFYVLGDIVTPSPSYLESPCFNLSESVIPVVEVGLSIHTEKDVDGATLEYSLDGGANWLHLSNSTPYNNYWNWYTGNYVSALGADGWSGDSEGWIIARQVLPQELIGESNVKFRFNFMCDGKNNDFDGVAIERFNVYELPLDLGVSEIISPNSDACEYNLDEQITVRIQNFGLRDMLAGETLNIGIDVEYFGDFPGESKSVEESMELTQNLISGETLVYSFQNRFNLFIPGEYTITAYTLGEEDPEYFSSTSNDKTTITVLVQKPYVDLGPDIYTVRPDTVTLVATSTEVGITYNWYDNSDLVSSLSTNDTFDVPTIEGGEFWVTLQNPLGCVAVDNITVHRLIADVGVSSYESPQSSCELSNQTPFSVWVTNFGTDTLKAGYTLTLGYQIGVQPIVDNIEWVLTEEVLPDSSILYTFDGVLMDMSSVGSYTLKAWATIADDYNTGNDLLEEIIEVWGYPTFSLGSDVGITANQYVVDAGAGWTAYYWHNDESTDRYFTMETTGTVTATVYDNNMCPATDDILVTLFFTSIGVGNVIAPLTDCEYLEEVTPKFNIENLGTNDLTAGTEITYKYSLNGFLKETKVFVTTEDLGPDQYFETDFTTSVDISDFDEYTFTFHATFDGDNKPEDDELIHVINVYGYPEIDLGADVYTEDDEYVLDAGPIADGYLWSTDETTQSITVTENGNYSVVATNGELCSVQDDVNVTFLRHDYGISELLNPTTSCSQIEMQSISVKLTNFGTETLSAGEEILLGYSINNQPAVEEVYTFTDNLTPGNSITFNFSQKYDFQFDGNYSVRVYNYFIEDINSANDELSETITIFPLPYTDLGQDTIARTGQIILDAGGGFESYTWSDGSPNQTLLVDETGYYWVTVTNEHQCQHTSDIDVTVLKPDFGVIDIISPKSSCFLTSAETVSVKIENFGTDILYPGEDLPVQLYVNGLIKANENVPILDNFAFGDVINYSFSTPVNLQAIADYTIEAKTFHPYDVDNTNNSDVKTVSVWGSPTITFPNLDPSSYCQNYGPVELTGGEPEGGVYSGNGVEGNYFYPDVAGEGNHTITYSYTDPNGCSAFRNITVSVLSVSDVTIPEFEPTCMNAEPIILTGATPDGGEYSGAGVANGEFNPVIAGLGTHTITYTYTDGNNCTNSASTVIEVYEQPSISITPFDPICIDAESFELTNAQPTGGTYSGIGVTDNVFNPQQAGVGTHSITYSFTDENGCSNSEQAELTVYDLPTVTLANFDPVCFNQEPYELSGGNPQGGTYSGSGVSENIFAPSQAGAGTHAITYNYTDGNGCGNSAEANLLVYDETVVTLADMDPICFRDEPFDLTLGTPTGGVYSGDGVYDGAFYPQYAGIGTHILTYTFTDNYNCVYEDNAIVVINPNPNVSLGDTIYVNDESFTLTAGVAGTYLWSDGSTGSSLTVYETGTYWLVVTNQYGCSASDTVYVDFEGTWSEFIPGTNTLIKVFPNPVKERLFIEIDSQKPSPILLELISPAGQLIRQKRGQVKDFYIAEIDVSGFSSGVYLLRVMVNGEWLSLRVVVGR